jgi:hypothetical protein
VFVIPRFSKLFRHIFRWSCLGFKMKSPVLGLSENFSQLDSPDEDDSMSYRTAFPRLYQASAPRPEFFSHAQRIRSA